MNFGGGFFFIILILLLQKHITDFYLFYVFKKIQNMHSEKLNWINK